MPRMRPLFAIATTVLSLYLVTVTFWLCYFSPFDDSKYLLRLRKGMSLGEVKQITPPGYLLGKLIPNPVEVWVDGVPIVTNGYVLLWHNRTDNSKGWLYFDGEKRLVKFPAVFDEQGNIVNHALK